MLDIVSRKFFNQTRNGGFFADNLTDFTDFLQGTICEKIKTETVIDVYWKSTSSPYSDDWVLFSAAGTGIITRNTGSFIADGFRVGDSVKITAPLQPDDTGVITEVTALEVKMSSYTGFIPDGTYSYMSMYGLTTFTGIIFNFNLIENSEADTFLSKVDNNTISYALAGISATDTLLVAQGNFKSWQDGGTVKIKSNVSPDPVKQRFTITHEFFITPFYLPSEYNDLQNGIAPIYLRDAASLKYIAKYELRENLYNPNIAHGGTDSVQLGNISWFDETYNGFNPIEFTLDTVDYTVASVSSNEINSEALTHVVVKLNSANNVFSTSNTPFIVNLFTLPENDSDYINTQTTMQENYLFDRCFQKAGGSGGTGDNNILINVESSVVSNQLVIEFDVLFTSAQKAIAKGKQYILSVIVDDHTATHATSKKVNVLVDYNDYAYTVDNPNLLTLNSCKFWEHPFDPTTPNTGTYNYKGWVTDGVYNETNFDTVNGLLNSLKFKVVALNIVTDDSFELMSETLNFTNFPVINNERIINYNSTRGFKLITGSLRNLVSLTRVAANNYLLKFAFKLRWEDYIQLAGVDSTFFDQTLLNNGFSQLWANYYDKFAEWKLKIEVCPVIEDIATGSQTEFKIQSDLDCHNFFEDGNTPPNFSGSIELFDGATSLGVDNAAKISKTADTKIVATFNSVNALASSEIYGIIFIEQYQQGGIFQQYQLSSEELPVANNWLKPLTGETKAKVTILTANSVKVECLIDYTKIPAGDISIFARIGDKCVSYEEVQASAVLIIGFTKYLITRFFDVIIDGVTVVMGGSVPAPYTLNDVFSAISTASGYIFYYNSGVLQVFAPSGTGDSANGIEITLVTYNENNVPLNTYVFPALSGGQDVQRCSPVVIETNRLLQEDGSYLLLEDDSFINLE